MTRHRIMVLNHADTAFGLVMLLATAATIWMWHHPTLTQVQALGDRLTEHRASRDRLDSVNAQVARLVHQAGDFETRLERFEQRLLPSQNGAYLEAISDVQNSCAISVEQIVPSSAIEDAFYDYVPLSIVTRGSFQNSLCFLNELEFRFRIGHLVAIRFHSDPRDNQCDMILDVRFYMDRRQITGPSAKTLGADQGV